MRYKIGIYTRVSTDEQALRSEGSLETQKLRILAEVENRNRRDAGWGKTVDFYQDDGYSAADFRPAYERLMADVRKGKINLIFVADYFRFCRNLLGYLQVAEQLKEIGAKVLSVKDNFDTETAMGQSMIRNYINMAQTERELTAERVSTNFHARAMRGLRNGGRVLFGFDRIDDDLARLSINEKEAAEVREIFRIFLEEATCSKAADRLNEKGPYRKTKSYKADEIVKTEKWSRTTLQVFLRNPVYAGLREVNRRNKAKSPESLREFERYALVKASWAPIVNDVTWKTVQESLDFAQEKARARISTKERRDYLLTGILRCAECGAGLMGAAAHGRSASYRYYVHRPVKGKKVSCSMNWVPAEELERPVIERLGLVLEGEGYLDRLEAKVVSLTERRRKDLLTERPETEASVTKFDSEIKKLIRLQMQCEDPTLDDVFQDQLRDLNAEKKMAKVRLEEIDCQLSNLVDPKEARDAVKVNSSVFLKAFKKANGTVRKRLLGFIFDDLTLGNCELNLFYSPTANSAVAVQLTQSQGSSDESSEDSPHSQKVVQIDKAVRGAIARRPLSQNFWDKKIRKHSVERIGRGDRIRTCDPLVPNQMRYQTALRPDIMKKLKVRCRIIASVVTVK